MAQMKTIAEMVMIMKSLYPHYLKDSDAKATATSWAVLFNDTTDKDFAEAFKRCLKKCKFPPTPADIENELKNKAAAKINTADEWDRLISTCEKINNLRCEFGYTFTPDGCAKTQGQMARDKAQQVFYDLPESIKKYIGSFSSLLQFAKEINGQNCTGISIRRREFEKWRMQEINEKTNMELLEEINRPILID